MATTPKPPARPAAKSHDEREDERDARRTVTREGGEDEPDAAAPPAPVTTIADEQRARSDEMAREGVEEWKAAHDERTEEEKAGNKQVTGVAPPAPSAEARSFEGSTRSTPAARHAQNPAAPR